MGIILFMVIFLITNLINKIMKSKNIILLFCTSTLALASCEQTEVIEGTSANIGISPSISLDVPYHVENDGALNFRSAKDYFEISDSLSKLSEKEFRNWETSNHFESYRTFTDNIIEAIYTAIDNAPSKVTELLNQNKQFVYMTEDSLIYSTIQSRAYQNIINKNGIFYINGIKNIVDSKYITLATTDNSKSIQRIAYLNPISSKERSEQINFDLFSYTKSDNTKRAYAECYLIKNTAFEDSHGSNQIMVQFQIKVDGKKKRPTGWKHYSTDYTVSQIKCIFNGIPTEVYPNGYVKPYGTINLDVPAKVVLGEGKMGFYTKNLMNFSVRNMSDPLKAPDCIHFKAETRGTSPEGVGYNYYKGKYIIPQNCIKGVSSICPFHQNVYSK